MTTSLAKYSTALIGDFWSEKSWQLGLEWGPCQFVNLSDVLLWCNKHHEPDFARRSIEWFRTERTCADEQGRTHDPTSMFWCDLILISHQPEPSPVSWCTKFRMADTQALNLQVLFALEKTGAVPKVLRADEDQAWYIAEGFHGVPLQQMGRDHEHRLVMEAEDEMANRLWDGLRAIHAAGWTLGDIRPESIFVDVRKEAILEPGWSEDFEDWSETTFVSQDFDAYFVYLGAASNSKDNFDHRVNTDRDALKMIIGSDQDSLASDRLD